MRCDAKWCDVMWCDVVWVNAANEQGSEANWIRMRVYFVAFVSFNKHMPRHHSYILSHIPNLSPEIESSNKTTSVCLIKVFGLQFRCYSSCCMLFFTCLFFVFQFSWFSLCLPFPYVNCVPYSSFATRFQCTAHQIPNETERLSVECHFLSLWSFNRKRTNKCAQCVNLFAFLCL